MGSAGEIASKEESKENNLFSVLGNFFRFPFPKVEPKSEEKTTAVTAPTDKPDVVRFPYKPPESPLELKLEAEEEPGKTSNPLVLWQVYAVGGILILRWVWGRWKERRARAGDDDGDASGHRSPPADASNDLPTADDPKLG